jgi:Sulfite exporter TauE/SafE
MSSALSISISTYPAQGEQASSSRALGCSLGVPGRAAAGGGRGLVCVDAVGMAGRCGVRVRAGVDHNPGRGVRRGAAAAHSAQCPARAEPRGHADEPPVQRRRHSRGAAALLAGRELSGRARVAISAVSLVVGTVGGIYGIGGGSILAPILLACGYSAYEVAPATLAATFLTSLVGVGAYQVLALTHGGSIAPDWILGLWVGAGGFIGSYLGARLQSRLPERSLRKLLGLIACVIAARYTEQAIHPRTAQAAVHAQR